MRFVYFERRSDYQRKKTNIMLKILEILFQSVLFCIYFSVLQQKSIINLNFIFLLQKWLILYGIASDKLNNTSEFILSLCYKDVLRKIRKETENCFIWIKQTTTNAQWRYFSSVIVSIHYLLKRFLSLVFTFI